MKKLLVAVALLGLPFSSFAKEKTATPTDGVKLIHASDLDKMLSQHKDTTYVFDANNEATRTKEGVIPGAKLLSSPTSYETSKLPTDKNATLVFYCANTLCMASHEAAKRAQEQGYKNSLVMADGIQGWKKAGKPTEKVTATN